MTSVLISLVHKGKCNPCLFLKHDPSDWKIKATQCESWFCRSSHTSVSRNVQEVIRSRPVCGIPAEKRRKLCHIVVVRCKEPTSVHNVYKGYSMKDACSSDFVICPMPQWTTCKLQAHGGHDSVKIACIKCILKCGTAVCHPKASVTYLQGCLPLSKVLPLVDYFSQSKIVMLLVGSWYWQPELLACSLASVLGFKFHHRGEKVTTKCLSESTLWIDAFSRRQRQKGHR